MMQRVAEQGPRTRIEREKDFHNERFSDEFRGAQDKYYAALSDCFEDYYAGIAEAAKGRDVLEYGCATGLNSRRIAPLCNSITGIDISDVAISEANQIASEEHIENARFHVMNAEDMSFDEASFDLVFGSGIIHHLDLESSFCEIARVLRPGGVAIFMEPLGTNALYNAYRYFTPHARTPDEHPLQRHDFLLAQRYFSRKHISFYGLATLLCVPFRSTPLFNAAFKCTRAIDRTLFKIDRLKWQAWYVLMRLER
jgi:SAM-dependent methyltransferase